MLSQESVTVERLSGLFGGNAQGQKVVERLVRRH
jgi:hypothetical protein